MDEKDVSQPPVVQDVGDENNVNEQDKEVMAQMGKKQRLPRRFNVITLLGLSLTFLSSWEAVGGSMGVGLMAGGPVALVYGFLFVLSGTLACAASVAEMASICPISGAQYHWTYMFAPIAWKEFLSFMQGWTTVFAWQATITSLTFLMSGQLQGIVVFSNASYTPERWHTSLIMWLVVLVAWMQNVWGIRLLPSLELFAGCFHVLMFFVFCIVMLVMGRNANADFVFTGFINETGWNNNAIAWFIGLLPSVWCIIGFDGAIHLSEETSNSATSIPKVIIHTVLINGFLAFLFILTSMFSISNISDVLSTHTGYPLIEIVFQATRSEAATTTLYAFILAITMAAMFGTLASVSRMTWAFARDDGLPFSGYLKHIDPTHKVPTRSITLVSVIVVLLSLINIGSSTALSAILSLSTIALYVSYIIPITCLIFLRLRVPVTEYKSVAGQADVSEERMVFGPWNLGAWGLYINIYGVCYASLLVPFMALPTSLPLTAMTMNYAGPVFGGVLLFAVADWLWLGKKRYSGPKKDR